MYVSRQFDPQFHNTTQFVSGSPPLDKWLRDQAAAAQVAGNSRTFVWTKAPGDPEVVGYYALAPLQARRDEIRRVDSGGCFSIVPGFLLARLALSMKLRGQGLGPELLFDAQSRALAAARKGGGRVLVVDALDDNATAFYVRNAFSKVPGSSRLLMKLADVAAALGEDWP